MLLWLGYALPLAVVDAVAGRWGDSALDLLQALTGVLAAWLFVATGPTIRRGFIMALGLLAVLASLEREAYRQVWKSPGLNPRTAIEPSLLWGVDRVSDPGTYRLWRRSQPSGALVMSFEARVISDVAVPAVTASVSVDLPDADSALGQSSRTRFTATPDWSESSLEFSAPELKGLADVRTVLRIPLGSTLELRNLRFVEAGSGARAAPVNPFPRQELWFGHPNLLGHSAALGGLAFAAFPGALAVSGAGLLASLYVVLSSGSRAALAALLIGAFVLFTLRARRAHGARWRATALVTAVVALLVAGYVMVIGGARADNGQVPRTLIVETAVDAMMSRPLAGLGPDASAFEDFWRARNGPPAAPVTHAHNWWLQNGVTHGLPGLAAGVWLFVCLAVIAWRSSRWPGLVLVACIGLLQLVDTTLLTWGVLLPSTLMLNTLGDHRQPWREGA